MPAPARTETVEGTGAVAHVLGVLFVPTRNVKSLAVMDPESPEMSTMMPLIPATKELRLANPAVPLPGRYAVFVGSIALSSMPPLATPSTPPLKRELS